MMLNSTIGNDGLSAANGATLKPGTYNLPSRFDLATHASLINVRISNWSALTSCAGAEEDAAAASGAAREVLVGKIRQVLKDEPLLVAVNTKVNEARNWYKENTSFWDGGSRLVTNLQYDRVMTKLRQFRAEFYAVVEQLLDGLPALETKAAVLQAKYAGGFPTRSELERKYAFDITPSAIADPNDIRLKHVSAEAAREIEASTRAMQNEKVTEIMTRLVDRIAKAMECFAGQMDSEKQRYHDTAVTNIQELAAIIPELNLTQDPGIEQVARHLREIFSTVTTKELKADPAKRDAMKAKAVDILAKVKGMKITNKI